MNGCQRLKVHSNILVRLILFTTDLVPYYFKLHQFLSLIKVQHTGTTNSVSIVDVNTPPTMANAIRALVSAPGPRPSIIGIIPSEPLHEQYFFKRTLHVSFSSFIIRTSANIKIILWAPSRIAYSAIKFLITLHLKSSGNSRFSIFLAYLNKKIVPQNCVQFWGTIHYLSV